MEFRRCRLRLGGNGIVWLTTISLVLTGFTRCPVQGGRNLPGRNLPGEGENLPGRNLPGRSRNLPGRNLPGKKVRISRGGISKEVRISRETIRRFEESPGKLSADSRNLPRSENINMNLLDCFCHLFL